MDSQIGPRGPRGPRGDKGDKGDLGEHGVAGDPGPRGPAPKTHLPWVWVTVAGILFTLALVGLTVKLTRDVSRASASRTEVAQAVSAVVEQRCAAENDVASVLRDALANERAILREKRADGEIPSKQFAVRQQRLDGNLAKLTPQDCDAQAALVHNATEGQ